MTGVKIPNITKEDVEGLTGFIKRTIEDRILNVFMPSRVTPAEDYKTTSELCSMWGTEYKVVDIQPAVDALAAVLLTGRRHLWRGGTYPPGAG